MKNNCNIHDPIDFLIDNIAKMAKMEIKEDRIKLAIELIEAVEAIMDEQPV